MNFSKLSSLIALGAITSIAAFGCSTEETNNKGTGGEGGSLITTTTSTGGSGQGGDSSSSTGEGGNGGATSSTGEGGAGGASSSSSGTSVTCTEITVGPTTFYANGFYYFAEFTPDDKDSLLYLDLYTDELGEFDLATAPNDDITVCDQCVTVEDAEGDFYFQSGGKIKITAFDTETGDLTATLTDATLVTLDEDGAPIPGGPCYHINSADLSRDVPEDACNPVSNEGCKAEENEACGRSIEGNFACRANDPEYPNTGDLCGDCGDTNGCKAGFACYAADESEETGACTPYCATDDDCASAPGTKCQKGSEEDPFGACLSDDFFPVCTAP